MVFYVVASLYFILEEQEVTEKLLDPEDKSRPVITFFLAVLGGILLGVQMYLIARAAKFMEANP